PRLAVNPPLPPPLPPAPPAPPIALSPESDRRPMVRKARGLGGGTSRGAMADAPGVRGAEARTLKAATVTLFAMFSRAPPAPRRGAPAAAAPAVAPSAAGAVPALRGGAPVAAAEPAGAAGAAGRRVVGKHGVLHGEERPVGQPPGDAHGGDEVDDGDRDQDVE